MFGNTNFWGNVPLILLFFRYSWVTSYAILEPQLCGILSAVSVFLSVNLLLTLLNCVALLISVKIYLVLRKLSRKANIKILKNLLLGYLFGLLCILISLVGSWICFYILDDCLCLWNFVALLISRNICVVSEKLSRKFGDNKFENYFVWFTHIDILVGSWICLWHF